MASVISSITDRETNLRSTEGLEDNVVSLDGPSDVRLDVEQADIASMTQRGDDLVITLQDGTQVVVENFYVTDDAGLSSRILGGAPGVTGDGGIEIASGLLLGGLVLGGLALGGAALAAGSGSDADTTAPATQSYDATPPIAPSVDTSNADELSGVAEPGSTVTLYDDTGAVVDTAAADPGTGAYSFAPNPLSDGDTGEVTATDAAGNEGAATPVPAVDATDPVLAITTPIESDGTVNASEAGDVLVEGTTDAEDGQTVTVTFSDGVNPVVSQTTNVLAGAWSLIGSEVDISGLDDGVITVTADVTDAAGNAAMQASTNVSLDTTPPAQPAAATNYDDNFGATQNTTSTDATTDDTTPGINVGTGLTDPRLYVDGSEVAATYDSGGGTLTPDAPLSNGTYNFTYTIRDAAGNESAQSGLLAIEIDDSPPSIVDLGADGQLIAPVQVMIDGATRTFYYWDADGDGLSSGGDLKTHEELDVLFNGGSDTTDTPVMAREATLNGVTVRLPTVNGDDGFPGSGFQNGTSVSSGAENQTTYDGLLAIWDAYNGSGTGTNIGGVPTAWASNRYWSATSTGSGSHARLYLSSGRSDSGPDGSATYVALEVV